MSGKTETHFKESRMKLLMENWRKFVSQQKIHKVNEKIYKQYAERLSDEMQKTFWDLPEDGKVFIIEDWI